MSEQRLVRGPYLSSIAGIYLLALTGVMVGIILVTYADAFERRGATYLLVGLLGLLVWGPVLWRVSGHSLDLAEPGIWFALFYFAHFGIRAIWDLTYGSPFLGLGPGAKDFGLVNTALFVSIIGFLSFWFGYWTRAGRAVARLLPSLPCKWNWSLVLPAAVLSAVLGWIVRVLVVVLEAGSFSAWMAANKDELLRLAEGTTYLEIMSGSLVTVALFLILIKAGIGHDSRLWTLFGLLFVSEALFGFIRGSRGAPLFLLLKVAIGFYMTSERTHKASLRFAWLTGTIVVLGCVLFPVVSAARFLGIGGMGEFLSSHLLWDPGELFRLVWDRLHGLDSLALIISKVPSEVPYTFASELGLLVISWIPRRIWLEKPTISLGEIFYKTLVPSGLFGEGTSVAITLPGQFYWDLGIVGIVIGMSLVGILWRFLHEYFVRPKGNLSNVLVVATVFPSFFIPVEQDLVSIFTGHLFGLFVVLIAALVVAKKRKIEV